MLPILVLANQLSHIFTTGAVASLTDLIIYKGLEGIRQRGVNGAHYICPCLKKFAKPYPSSPASPRTRLD